MRVVDHHGNLILFKVISVCISQRIIVTDYCKPVKTVFFVMYVCVCLNKIFSLALFPIRT